MGDNEIKPEVKKELKAGDEGYLYGGKYKTVEEMEKGVKEGEKKITELGQSKAQSDKALLESTSVINSLRSGSVEKDEKAKAEGRKVKVTAFKTAFEKDPDAALSIIESLVDERLKGSGVMKTSEYDDRIAREKTAATEFNRIKSAHKEDFDTLKPEMSKLWAKLPEKARVPEMLETVYLAAKASASPSLRDKIAADIKAGSTVAPASVTPDDKRSKDEKDIDAIVTAHKESKNF